MKGRLAVIILHYGEAALTARLHDQLKKSDPEWPDLFVLDNCAPDPYPDAWERLDRNRYWAGALDYAARRCMDEGFSHLWFLNNDLLFQSRPPFIATAWQRLRRLDKTLGPVGIYSPSATRNPYHPQMVQAQDRQYRSAAYVDGIAPLFNLDCLDDLGGVDFQGNDYGYGVDVALSLTAHRAGWPVVIDHQVCLRHIYHTTARQVDGFLEKAGKAEDVYMRRVLGRDWREAVAREQREFTDHDRM